MAVSVLCVRDRFRHYTKSIAKTFAYLFYPSSTSAIIGSPAPYLDPVTSHPFAPDQTQTTMFNRSSDAQPHNYTQIPSSTSNPALQQPPLQVLDKLSAHVESLVKVGQAGIDLKELLVEGEVATCISLGMKGLVVSYISPCNISRQCSLTIHIDDQGREALNPWKVMAIHIPVSVAASPGCNI